MLVSPANAARALGVSRQRIEQLIRRGKITRVDIGATRNYGVPWDQVAQRAKDRGIIMRPVQYLQTCDICSRSIYRPHLSCVKRAERRARPSCAAPGCIAQPDSDLYCKRCRSGYAPKTRAPSTIALYSNVPCAQCGTICSPQRTKACDFYGVPPTCVKCLKPNRLQRLRGGGRRVSGYATQAALG